MSASAAAALIALGLALGPPAATAERTESTARPAREAPPATPSPATPPHTVGGAATAFPLRRSRALGHPWAGRLARGVQLPVEGPDFFTWDPARDVVPNRSWRRWGTDRLLRTIDLVLLRYRAANPGAPRVGIGDLSRRRGGIFDERFGGLGHASHQNGRDVDVYYPRLDRLETAARRPRQVDRELAQRLVDLFVAAGAEKVFVGPRLHLRGPRGVVIPLRHHDDHLHARIP